MYIIICFIYIILAVLIETLWNVKSILLQELCRQLLVLIETLWNVKFLKPSQVNFPASGINRNIVECKGPFFL